MNESVRSVQLPRVVGVMRIPGGLTVTLHDKWPTWFHRMTMRIVFGFTFVRGK